MTGDVDALIEAVLRDGPEAGAAFDALSLAGERAVPSLVAGLQAGRGHAVFAAVLAALEVPDRVATLAPLAAHDARGVRDAAIAALGRSGDPRAAGVIGDVLAHGGHLLRSLGALGDLGAGREAIHAAIRKRVGDVTDPAVLAEVSARAVEDLDPSDLQAIGAAAEALAKQGDAALIGAAKTLAGFSPDEEAGFYEASGVRQQALRALDVAVAPGIAPVLHAATADGDAEVAMTALYATLHLGRIAAAPAWLAALASERGAVASAAAQCFEELTGERPPDAAREAIAWWARLEATLDPAVCYRRGALASPGVLIDPARGAHSAWLRVELGYLGGLTFLHPELSSPTPREAQAIAAWWAANAARFTPGKLHRWGRVVEPGAVD